MLSILFVDDEVSLLEGIRDALYKRTSEWRLEFAQSGTEALEILFKSKFDIIVSDMQMPGMDGVTLLGHVQAKYPHMTRFLLTGQADREAIVRMMPVTHQFIYKPCSASDLVSLLDRASALHARIQNEFVRRIVSGAKFVPSAPKTAMKMANLISKGEATMSEMAALIERDPGLSARVLQVSNSAVFARSREVTSVLEAVSFVGFECAQALAIANEAFRITPENKFLSRLIEDTCDKAFWGANLVSKFLSGHPSRDMAMTAALIRDIGILVSANANAGIYRAVMDPKVGIASLLEVERACLGVTHAEIGGHLLTLWGIPMKVVEAVTYHHTITEAPVEPVIMAAIHVADIVAENGGAGKDAIADQINWLFMDVHDLREKVEGWLETDFGVFRTAA